MKPYHLFIAFTFLILAAHGVMGQTPQQHVHSMSHHVMPFDMTKTLHVFKMTETGGVQRVMVRDKADKEQIALIRQHLHEEAARFQKGDFGDPARLHGASMPGLQDLQTGAKQIKITYSELPEGAEIVYQTKDLHLLTSIHRWFGAQLSEHGADASAE